MESRQLSMSIRVYVLHCFQKKSSSGIKTAKKEINLIQETSKIIAQELEENYERED